MKRLAVLFGLVAAMTSAISAQAASAEHTSSPVHLFSNGSVVAGAQGDLVTNSAGASMTLRTSGLTTGDAVTAWWIVFNYPANCAGPAPWHPFQCGASDLSNPAVGGSVLYATGHIIGASGRAGFGAHVATGDTGGALFGPGLINPLTAHIHVVVCDNGPARAGNLDRARGSFGSFSPACFVQFAVFEQS